VGVNLTKEAIVTTALNILDSYGLQDVSMRRIASTLGVQPSALYWHFASKQDLLAGIADAILADLPPYSGGDLTRLPLWAARLHGLLLSHRDGAELVWSVLAIRDWEGGIGYQVEKGLLESGLTPQMARAGAQGFLHLVLGHAFDEDQRNQAVRLKVIPTPGSPDSAKVLDDAVAIFVAGLEANRTC